MLSCPREILALIAPNPAEMRALHQTCRAIATRTYGTFHRVRRQSQQTGATWPTLEIHGTYTCHTIEFDHDNSSTLWTVGRDFDGDITPFNLMPDVGIWEFSATVDNLMFAAVTGVEAGVDAHPRVMTGLVSDRETAEQFVGTYIDKLYVVVGFHNNFRGVNYAECVCGSAPAPGGYVFAVKTAPYKWIVHTTNTPLHLIRGTVLALELVRD